MIEITDSAARVITRQLEKQHKAGGGLRIAIKAGGCSGFSYTFAWDDGARESDAVFEGALEQPLTIAIEGASFITSYARRDAVTVALSRIVA